PDEPTPLTPVPSTPENPDEPGSGNPDPNNPDKPTVIETAEPEIVAENDLFEGIDSKTGRPNAGNVLHDNGNGTDGYNGGNASIDDVTITVITEPSPQPHAPEGNENVPYIDESTGTVIVPAETPAGTYEIEYQIEDKLNPGNTSTATVTVVVDMPVIEAITDSFSGSEGDGLIGNVLTNDLLNKEEDPSLDEVEVTVLEPAQPKDGAPTDA